MFKKTVLFIFLFCLQYKGAISLQTADLTIADGPIQGVVNYTARNNVYYRAFRGIPYAEPPVGNLRFAPPQPNSPWTEPLNTTEDRDECVQYLWGDFLGSTVYGKEDCLYINVYTPYENTTTTSNLPVIIWIYGGGFIAGSSKFENYGPERFLEQGLLFVSFNYRLGIFGFLSTEDLAASGNWGIKDQILALKWVQANIAFFGGDPNNVTIFGESAGATSVNLLMQTNQTNGTFHKAIMNSGSSLNLWGLCTRALETAKLVAFNLGVLYTNTTGLVAGLRKIEAEKLQEVGWRSAASLFLTNGLRGLPYAPVIEPSTVPGAVLTQPSDDLQRAGNFQKVPVLMGFNNNEAAAASLLPDLLRLYLLYYDVATNYLSPYSMTSNEATRLIAGQTVKNNYFGLLPIASDLNALTQFLSDDQFNRPIRRAATNMAKFVTLYFYELSHNSNLDYPGAGHADDLKYFFSNFDVNGTVLKVSDVMVKLWANFAIYGNPTPFEDSALNNTKWWPVDQSSSNFSYLCINESISNQVNPKQDGWTFYEGLFAEYGNDSYTTY